MKENNKTAKFILDTLSKACNVPIHEICLLDNNEMEFKAYVHGTSWYDKNVINTIKNTWGIVEDNIKAKISPNSWWSLGSYGYIIEVKY